MGFVFFTLTKPGSLSGESVENLSLFQTVGIDEAFPVSPMGKKSGAKFAEDLELVIDSSEVMLYFLTTSFSRAGDPTDFRLCKTLAELALRNIFGFRPVPKATGTLSKFVGCSGAETGEGPRGVIGADGGEIITSWSGDEMSKFLNSPLP